MYQGIHAYGKHVELVQAYVPHKHDKKNRRRSHAAFFKY
ncbi:hypothetical protein BN1007_30218 [Klebsiella variicola]|nr:hypothetical protein BN1007_30218 [Klebsiella variicola]